MNRLPCVRARLLIYIYIFFCLLCTELMFLETSALTGENVEEGFLKCARTIRNKIESGSTAHTHTIADTSSQAKFLLHLDLRDKPKRFLCFSWGALTQFHRKSVTWSVHFKWRFASRWSIVLGWRKKSNIFWTSKRQKKFNKQFWQQTNKGAQTFL